MGLTLHVSVHKNLRSVDVRYMKQCLSGAPCLLRNSTFSSPQQMAEPTCSQRFDFEYERVFGTGDIPKDELQKIMYKDVLHFSPAPEDPTAAVTDKLAKSLLIKEDHVDKHKDDPDDKENACRK